LLQTERDQTIALFIPRQISQQQQQQQKKKKVSMFKAARQNAFSAPIVEIH
jgi:hypothetical protein